MTPTVETSIWMALKGRVASLALSPALPVAYPNEAFTPPVEASGPNKGTLLPYLKVEHIPNRTLRVFLPSDSPHHFRGILQIGLMAKINLPLAVALEVAGDIAGHFPADLELASQAVSVRVTGRPSLGPAMPQATHLLIPVSVEYEAWA